MYLFKELMKTLFPASLRVNGILNDVRQITLILAFGDSLDNDIIQSHPRAGKANRWADASEDDKNSKEILCQLT